MGEKKIINNNRGDTNDNSRGDREKERRTNVCPVSLSPVKAGWGTAKKKGCSSECSYPVLPDGPPPPKKKKIKKKRSSPEGSLLAKCAFERKI